MTTETTSSSPTLQQTILRHSTGLGLFAIVTAGIIAITQTSTEDRIAKNIQQAEVRILTEVLPSAEFDNDLLNDNITIKALSHIQLPPSETSEQASEQKEKTEPFQLNALGPVNDNEKIYIAKKNGELIGFIFPAIAPDGYTAPIKLRIAVRKDGSLFGVRVVAHKETPGLGDGIESKKSDWILAFNDKSLDHPSEQLWFVKKDGGAFDQLTGATITPRAIVLAVKKTLKMYHQQKHAFIHVASQLTANQP